MGPVLRFAPRARRDGLRYRQKKPVRPQVAQRLAGGLLRMGEYPDVVGLSHQCRRYGQSSQHHRGGDLDYRSTPLQKAPSSQVFVSSGAKTQPVAGLHESSVHGFSSSHSNGSPETQLPAMQDWRPLHTPPSSHEFVSSGVNTQIPEGSQESSVQGLPSSHRMGVPAQLPCALHTSLAVQASPSSQEFPGAGVWTHKPPTHESSVHGF